MENKEKNEQFDKVLEAIFRDMVRLSKPGHIQPLKPPCTMEILADADHVSIPTSRFAELVQAETKLSIAKQVRTAAGGRYADVLIAILFRSVPEEVTGNAQ